MAGRYMLKLPLSLKSLSQPLLEKGPFYFLCCVGAEPVMTDCQFMSSVHPSGCFFWVFGLILYFSWLLSMDFKASPTCLQFNLHMVSITPTQPLFWFKRFRIFILWRVDVPNMNIFIVIWANINVSADLLVSIILTVSAKYQHSSKILDFRKILMKLLKI